MKSTDPVAVYAALVVVAVLALLTLLTHKVTRVEGAFGWVGKTASAAGTRLKSLFGLAGKSADELALAAAKQTDEANAALPKLAKTLGAKDTPITQAEKAAATAQKSSVQTKMEAYTKAVEAKDVAGQKAVLQQVVDSKEWAAFQALSVDSKYGYSSRILMADGGPEALQNAGKIVQGIAGNATGIKGTWAMIKETLVTHWKYVAAGVGFAATAIFLEEQIRAMINEGGGDAIAGGGGDDASGGFFGSSNFFMAGSSSLVCCLLLSLVLGVGAYFVMQQ